MTAEPDDPHGRRAFLERMGAGLAAVGLEGCLFNNGDPPEQIVAYTRQPEYVVPGLPLMFASAFARDAYAYGILVETHEGRPTKIEGQPEHMSSLGATCPFGQAAVRELYDPQRASGVRHHGQVSSWPAFLAAARSRLGAGARAAILTPQTTSRMVSEAVGRLAGRHPGLRWFAWSPVSRDAIHAGLLKLKLREGALSCHLRIDRARAILSLDDDFLSWCSGRLRHARALAYRRRPELGEAGLRLYVLESFPTITGAAADHRRAVRVTEVPALARAVLRGIVGAAVPADPWLAAAVADLRRAGSAGLVVAGPQQPAHVHALAHAANFALGAAGETVVYTQRLERQPEGEAGSLAGLVTAIDRGEIDALIIMDGNPVYNSGGELDLAGHFKKVGFTAHLGLGRDETGEACEWQLPLAHPLEAWGDFRGDDGSVTLSQPTIRPLHGGLTAAELLTALADDATQGRDLLERTWADAAPNDADPALWWRGAIHDGQLPIADAAVTPALDPAVLNALLGEYVPEDIDNDNKLVLAFRPDPAAWDGRFVGDPWLQELPRPITGLVWGNAAYIAPETAKARDLAHEELVRLEVGGRMVEAPLYIIDGHPRGQVTVHLGYGRRVGAGAGLGFDAYRLRTGDSLWSARGLEVRAVGVRGRLIVDRHRAGDDARGAAYARWATRAAYGRAGARAFGGQVDAPELRPPSLHPTRPLESPAWAMTIDLTACIGCGACVVACQAENNIPTVGAAEAARGRIMHWIRIDTYAGEDEGPRWRFQPVPCMHCEHAPCELVCPTGATQHSHDGLNDMVYNRCVGTRYCSNNCPYKVRRFNFFDYVERDVVTLRLQRNPDVTVRTRGVMEKCTYCVQRIRGAENAARREGRAIGDVVTACQGACPGAAIDFGDLTRAGEGVAARRREGRAYALLHELGARPRTSYLGRLHHPNPALPGGDDEA